MYLKLLVAVLIFSAAMQASAQETPLITMQVAENTYSEGESVVVSGNVAAVIPDTDVIIQVYYRENQVHVGQIRPSEDGSFIHIILAQGPLWKNDGEYLVRTSYGTESTSEANFNFLKDDSVQGTADVDIPDSTSTADIRYTIKRGEITSVIVDDTRFSLLVIIEPSSRGVLTIDLPREVIDAKTNGCRGADGEYIVAIDGIQAPYQEIDKSADRVITIEFEEGDREIEIIGTCIIPEFGSMALAVLAVSTVSIAVLSRKTHLRI